jgi:hypothetical protein
MHALFFIFSLRPQWPSASGNWPRRLLFWALARIPGIIYLAFGLEWCVMIRSAMN